MQEINALNDEIQELEMQMKRKDRLLKEQSQTLEENRLVEKTLQDFFVEHLKENLRQKAQDLHINFISQSLNKRKMTTQKKEKGYFSDEEKSNHPTSLFPKLDEFFPVNLIPNKPAFLATIHFNDTYKFYINPSFHFIYKYKIYTYILPRLNH